MDRPLTKDDILKAADYYAKKGTMPTITLVRERLGKGSETLLSKHLKEWKDNMLQVYVDSLTPKLSMVEPLTRPYKPQPLVDITPLLEFDDPMQASLRDVSVCNEQKPKLSIFHEIRNTIAAMLR